MPISSKKITNFTKTVSQLATKPNQSGLTDVQVKAQFDAAPEELRVAYNGLIDILLGVVAGDSGAENIGSATIAGVTGATVYAQLVDLKTQLNNVVLGQIPDGSLTTAKLADGSVTTIKQANNSVTYNKLDTNNQVAASSGTIYAYKNLGGF